MHIGKDVRMRRIMNSRSRRVFILAMDHGFSEGPIAGLTNITKRLRQIGEDALNAVIVHQGMVPRVVPVLQDARHMGLIVHLSGSTVFSEDVNDKRLVCSVEQAVRLGADAVSVHINLGADTESRMLSELGQISQSCQEWGMPLLAMMYPRGKRIENPYLPKYIAHAIRVAVEMGVDLVKTYYTGDIESFARILEDVDTPVVIAGGPHLDSTFHLFKMIHDALQAGAAGVCFGRNVFQSPHADRIAEAIENVVHKNFSIQEALSLLEDIADLERSLV